MGSAGSEHDAPDRLEVVLAGAGVAIWRWHPDDGTGRVTGADPAGEPLDAAALLAAIEPEDRHAVELSLADAAAGGPIDVRFRLRGGDAPRWLQLRGGGEPAGPVVIAALIDVTDQVAGRATDLRRRQETVRQHAALRRLIRRLVEGGDLEPVLTRVARDLADALEVARVVIWTLEADGGSFRRLALVEAGAPQPGPVALLPVAGFPRYLEAVRRERTIAADDALTDPYTGEHAAYLREHGITSVLLAPCRQGGEVLGVVWHEHVGPARAWTAEEQAFAATVADAVALAIEGHRRRHAERARSELEQSLRQAQKMESLGLLAGGVAHDLNNLLTPILMGAEMVKSALGRGSAHVDLIESIMSAAIDARELVGQLLAFSRKQVLELRELDAGEEVRRVVKLLRRTMPETIEIELALTPDQALRADPPQLQQVLVNLAINARDAMPTGGILRLSTFPVEVAGVAMVGIAVEDTGVGMDADTLPHIFEPFFTTKGLGRGTGLGLSTVYGIVQQHNGTLQVDSVVGRGTRFELRLPVARAGDARRSRRTSDPAVHPAAGTILVVEDEPAVRRLVVRLLAREGYRILDAAGPDEALELSDRHAGLIDLVLTDVVMPGMNGRRLFEAISATRPDARVVYMSGYDHDVLAPQGLLAADVRLLRKPFTAADLLRGVRDALTTEPSTG